MHSVLPSATTSATYSSAARSRRRSRHSRISRGRCARPSLLHSSLSCFGRGGVDVEMHGAQLVRPQRPRVLHCPRSRHVQLADEHEHDVALQDGRLRGCCGTRLELFLLGDVLPVQPDAARSTSAARPLRRSMRLRRISSPGGCRRRRRRAVPANPLISAPARHRRPRIRPVMLDHAEPGEREAGEDTDRVQADERVRAAP